MGLGALVGTTQGAFHVLGNRLDSFKDEQDEFERKEVIRRTTRVPVEQTVAEIGEGRGMSRRLVFSLSIMRVPTRSTDTKNRHQASWLRGAQETTHPGEVRRRDQPCQRDYRGQPINARPLFNAVI